MNPLWSYPCWQVGLKHYMTPVQVEFKHLLGTKGKVSFSPPPFCYVFQWFWPFYLWLHKEYLFSPKDEGWMVLVHTGLLSWLNVFSCFLFRGLFFFLFKHLLTVTHLIKKKLHLILVPWRGSIDTACRFSGKNLISSVIWIIYLCELIFGLQLSWTKHYKEL